MCTDQLLGNTWQFDALTTVSFDDTLSDDPTSLSTPDLDFNIDLNKIIAHGELDEQLRDCSSILPSASEKFQSSLKNAERHAHPSLVQRMQSSSSVDSNYDLLVDFNRPSVFDDMKLSQTSPTMKSNRDTLSESCSTQSKYSSDSGDSQQSTCSSSPASPPEDDTYPASDPCVSFSFRMFPFSVNINRRSAAPINYLRPLLLPQVVKDKNEQLPPTFQHLRQLLLPHWIAMRTLRRKSRTASQMFTVKNVNLNPFEAFIILGLDQWPPTSQTPTSEVNPPQ